MISQGMRASLLFSLLLALLYLGARSAMKVKIYDLYYGVMGLWGAAKLSVLGPFFDPHKIFIDVYDMGSHQWKTLSVLAFEHRLHLSPSWGRLVGWYHWATTSLFVEAVICWGMSMAGCFLFFSKKGQNNIAHSLKRGSALISPHDFSQMLRKKKRAGFLKVGKLHLMDETKGPHILLSGATGSGKTTLLHIVLPQLRKRGDRVVVVDMNGDFVSSYFDPTAGDALLNPLDARSQHWSPWADAKTDSDFDLIAKALMGKEKHSETFWDTAPRQILAQGLKKMKSKPSLHELIDVLTIQPLKEFHKFFRETPVAPLTDPQADKTTVSLRSSLTEKILPLLNLKDTSSPFSIHDFLHHKKGWLFLASLPHQRATLAPLQAIFLENVLQGLMQQTAHDTKRPHTWVVIDELPALTLPSLKTFLAESRKYGVSVVAAFQNIHQLFAIYGAHEAKHMMDQFATTFFFQGGDIQTAQLTSQSLGEKEVVHTKESLSYGANTMRDGVNLHHEQTRDPLVLPTEIMGMDPLTCYVKMTGLCAITHITLSRPIVTKRCEGFVPPRSHPRDTPTDPPEG